MLKRLFDRAFRRGKPATAAPAMSGALPDDVEANLVSVPREQHSISRRNISPNALRVLYKLRDGGFAAYLVGGAVRDLLLGGHPKDFDVATDAHPEQVKQLFRNCRLIGRRFRLAHVHFGAEIIEVATFRGTEDDGSGARELVDGRIVRDNVYGSIEEDAVRRDFTINALYYAVEDFSVRDYVGGFKDVQERVLRLIGDPDRRFREDPVRMLRAARFSAKLGFSIDPAAVAAMARLRQLIVDAPPARLFDECVKLFMAGHALQSFRVLRDLQLLDALLPASAEAVRRDPAALMLVESALQSTDERVRDGKPVTPAFLFAALLWPAMQAAVARREASEGADAWVSAAQEVVSEQCSRIALPKRFSLPMQEIWLLQPRLDACLRKRAGRLLAHPRFRAAYDFLLFRAHADERLGAAEQFWTELQGGSPPEAVVRVSMASGAAPRDESAAPRKRRKRRRKPTSGQGSSVSPDSAGD